MTQEEKRFKLAQYAFSQIQDQKWALVKALADYFNDLNAMHELEKVLTDKQARTYAYTLYDLANGFQFDGDPWTPDIFEASMDGVAGMVRTTAAQRAEAIGLTLGLWTA